MNKMVVGIDFTQDGTRTISEINFGLENYDILMHTAQAISNLHDEVYIVDFDPNSQPFIDEIVLKGCKIS